MDRRLFSRSAALVALTAGLVTSLTVPSATAQAPTPAASRLNEVIDRLLTDARLDGAQASVVVADAATGTTLYNRNGDRRLLPASNTKLLTSTAAMELLGVDHRFTTDVRATGDRRAGVVKGDLYLRGGGDPTMLGADYDKLAADVAASGVRLVTGNLVADDTRYDNVRLGPDWTWDDEPYYYAAQVSALTVAPNTDYDAGTAIINASPAAAAGKRPAITMTPPNTYLTIDNQATTVATGSTTISFERQHGSNTIVVTGQIAVGSATESDWVSVWEPTGYAADVFRNALNRHGVKVIGRTVLGRATPASAPAVASHQSMTLGELMVPFLKLSNNGHAEVLAKEIGKVVSGSGTWSAGIAAIRGYAGSVGLNTATLNQRDGSGLSRRDFVPPAEFVHLLVAARAEPWFNTWYQALPIAGNSERFVGGTLRSRMADTPAANNVHAKTGSLTGASALSGYVTDADGRQLVFSVITNNYLASTVKDIEDQIAVALASYSEQGASTMVVPKIAPAPAAPDGIECSWVKPDVC